MSNSDQYDVNFFRPLSNHAKANTRLIKILASIWAIAVFGFQILLMILNSPTPEKSYEQYQSVYPAVVQNVQATSEQKITFAKSLLNVLGKNIAVNENHKIILKKSLTWIVASLQPDSIKSEFYSAPSQASFSLASKSLNLQSSGFDKIMIDLIPTSLVKLENENFPEDCKVELPGIMNLYLVHNQNFLTDLYFLGFPFHYWFTAQFLLLLFVVLCVIYAVSIDKANSKHNFVEET